jgi:hypothetical protein
MKFEGNIRNNKEGRLSARFNAMVGKALDANDFYEEAETTGWQEARVFKPGETLRFEGAQQHSRINAIVDETGVLKGFRCG